MRYYRRDGSTFDDDREFARILADIAYRRVAYTSGDGWSVSTVFLCLDHNFSGSGPPLVYETLAEPGDRIERYPNEVAALAGHDQWVETMRQRAAPNASSADLSHGDAPDAADSS